jgi:hypothetical protein
MGRKQGSKTMQLSDLQILAAQSFVSVFETGSVNGTARYSTVTYNPDDPGELSYGKHQVTLSSGNLYNLICRYCQSDKSSPLNA